ncbi:MAG: hypothetical protein ACRD2U_13735 [Terriglobales bacterium]
MRRTIGIHMLFVFLFLMTTVGFAQDFTADAYSSHSAADEVAKIFVSGNKVRIEPQRDSDNEGFVIWDVNGHHYMVVMPQRHMFMDFGGPMMQQQVLAFWRPADANNACPDWERLAVQFKAHEKLGSCHKVGNDTVNGRSAVKYEGSSTDGKTGDVWVDTKLHFLIKMADADGNVTELRNIREGSQPDSLFEVPAGYQKMEMGGGMKMNRPEPPSH